VGEVQAGNGGDLQAAGLDPAVAAVAGVVGDRDLALGQSLELLVQGGLVGLDDQQVGGALDADQPVGVVTLGVEGVGGDDSPGQVQRLQQRLEAGDLVGGVVDIGLAQDTTASVVHRGEREGTLSLSPTGEGPTVDLRVNANWWTVPAVPGDESTGELTQHGNELTLSSPTFGVIEHIAGLDLPEGDHRGVFRLAVEDPQVAAELCAALTA
jgi:hypothetical protein